MDGHDAPSAAPPPMPLWVKLILGATAVAVVLFVVLHLLGRARLGH